MAACAGRFVVRLLLGPDEPPSRLFLYGVPSGVTVVSILILCVGLVGFLTPLTCWAMFGAGAIVVGATFWREGPTLVSRARGWLAKNLQECSRESALLLTLIGALAVVNLMWAAAPEIEYDALNYHLAAPRIYLDQHRISELPFYHSYYVRNLEMFFAWAMALGGGEAVKFLIFGLGVAAAWAAYQLGAATFGRRAGLWAAALFYTTPLVGWESGAVYIDNVIALFVTCGLLAVILWLESGADRALPAVAVLAGAAIGAKLNAGFAFAVAGPVTLWRALRFQDWNRYARKLRTLLYAVAAFVVAALPCYALFWWYTGNPVFPLLNGFFGSPKWVLENSITGSSNYGTERSLLFLLRLPFRLTLDTRRYAEYAPNGLLGISLLVAFPFACLLLANHRKGVRLLAASAIGHLVLLFYTMQYARYAMPILPAICAMGAGLAVYLADRRAAALVRMSLLVGLAFQFPVRIAMYSAIEDPVPVAVATGAETREHFLNRALPGYSAAMYLNRVARPGEEVLTAGLENMRYYLKPELRTPYLSVVGDPLREVEQKLSDSQVRQVLRRCGISWVLFFQNQVTPTPEPWQPFLRASFLERYGKLEFSDRGVNVYRLIAGPE